MVGMFTGIIQNTGKIISLTPRGDALTMKLFAPQFFLNSKAGDSVANNGVCLTIEECGPDEATFCLIHQTVQNTAFAQAKEGDLVNLELPCTPQSLMGGHFVMGHVDSTAQVVSLQDRETGVEVGIELPENLKRYVIHRGSVTLNGISLTVAEIIDSIIVVAIIPETLTKTNLSLWNIGTLVNVEVDMIGKYVENFLKGAKIAEYN
jgi:riboflavin synthase